MIRRIAISAWLSAFGAAFWVSAPVIDTLWPSSAFAQSAGTSGEASSVEAKTAADDKATPEAAAKTAPAGNASPSEKSAATAPSAAGVASGPKDGVPPVGTQPVAESVSAKADDGQSAERVRQPSASASSSEGAYQVRLRDLERRVGELKEQVFRSKTRLALLAESVLHGVVAGSQAHITHENRMSSSFRLVRAVYALDGAPILDRADDEGLLRGRREFEVFNGSISPGEHILTVNLEYRGDGYGVFTYMKGYHFSVRSSFSFTAPPARLTDLRVVGHEKGGALVPVEERPAIRFAQQVVVPSRAKTPASGRKSKSSRRESSLKRSPSNDLVRLAGYQASGSSK